MQISSVANSTIASTDLSATASKSLDKMAFLKLLTTQLRYQNPMSPMDDKEFVSQLAQFSTLEQMQSLNTGFESFDKSGQATQAFALIGRTVEYADPDSETPITGTVNKVTFEDGLPKLNIGTKVIDLGDVVAVY